MYKCTCNYFLFSHVKMAAMNATINRLNKTTQEIKNAKTYNPDLSNDIESLQKVSFFSQITHIF